jgi:hypothetical protein
MSDVTPQSPALPVPEKIWLHGLWMLVLVILVNLSQTVLGVCAIFQFLWMLFTGGRNARVAEFGRGVANWLAITARFLSGSSDEKPFPWTAWR